MYSKTDTISVSTHEEPNGLVPSHVQVTDKAVHSGTSECLPNGGIGGGLLERVEVASNSPAENDRILNRQERQVVLKAIPQR